jgi:hypothetical protein
MSLFVTLESMDRDIGYECKSYQYLHNNCGYYYHTTVRKFGDSNDKTMIVTNGIIFDYLQEVRERNSFTRFTFKKKNLMLSETNNEDVIIIIEHNNRVVLN